MVLDPVIIELDGPPVGKGRPRFGQGRTFTPAKTRAYEEALKLTAMAAMRGRIPLSGPLMVEIHAGMPVPASWSARKRESALAGVIAATVKPDADNLLKCIDALNKVVFVDDAQIVQAYIRKFYAAQPSLRIEVRLAP